MRSTGWQLFQGKRKGESNAVDNSRNTIDSMGTWFGVRLYNRWFHSRSDSNCRCGRAGQDNFRPTAGMIPHRSEKERL
jgi:hypothetical protein